MNDLEILDEGLPVEEAPKASPIGSGYLALSMFLATVATSVIFMSHNTESLVLATASAIIMAVISLAMGYNIPRSKTLLLLVSKTTIIVVVVFLLWYYVEPTLTGVSARIDTLRMLASSLKWTLWFSLINILSWKSNRMYG